MKLPLTGGEGPVGVVICPVSGIYLALMFSRSYCDHCPYLQSRELARQTYETTVGVSEALAAGGKYPELRTILAIGGVDMRETYRVIEKGLHMVVATPGRLQHLLQQKKINFDNCRYLCMDEADRMLDEGFDEDVRTILSFFKYQRQTVLYSATMPERIRGGP